jgi:hypothetical protein
MKPKLRPGIVIPLFLLIMLAITLPAYGAVPDTPDTGINSTDGTNSTSQDLNCFGRILDQDNDKMNVTIIWYNNGVLNLTLDYNESYDNGTDLNAVLGSDNTSAGQNWSCSMRLNDGINFSEWGESNNLTIAGLLSAPSDATTSEYAIAGSVYGTMTGGSTSVHGQIINFTHGTWGKRIELIALFNTSDVNLSSLVIQASSGKTAVNLAGIAGVETTHTIFLPNNFNSGLYVCPDAKTLAGVNQSCSGIIGFSYNDALSGITKSGIKAEMESGNYKISGITGSGSGENPYLEVDLITPISGLNVPQNATFSVNATVYCRNGECGNVNGALRYNDSSQMPDTNISAEAGTAPFYIKSGGNPQDCGGNPLSESEFCNLTWIVNATGSQGSDYKLGVIFQSDGGLAGANFTKNNTVKITGCLIDITLQWSGISFGVLTPGDRANASGNDEDYYNVTVEPATSCSIDLYINGTGLENQSLGYAIGAGNISWSNTTNDYAGSHQLESTWDFIGGGIAPGENTTTWYWLDMPYGIASGNYAGMMSIKAVPSGESP